MKTIHITQESTLVYRIMPPDEDYGMWDANVDDNKYIQLIDLQRKMDVLQQELYDIIQKSGEQ